MPKQIGNIKLYSLIELSKILEVTTVTLRNYLLNGRLKGRKMGTRWFVTEDNIKEYFSNSHNLKGKNRITLNGITQGSTVTDKDIKKVKEIWK